MWKFLHACAHHLEDREAFNAQLRLLTRVLPCEECRRHMTEHLLANPPENHIRNTRDAGAYLFALHNTVNLACTPPKRFFTVDAYESLYGSVNHDMIPLRFLDPREQEAATERDTETRGYSADTKEQPQTAIAHRGSGERSQLGAFRPRGRCHIAPPVGTKLDATDTGAAGSRRPCMGPQPSVFGDESREESEVVPGPPRHQRRPGLHAKPRELRARRTPMKYRL